MLFVISKCVDFHFGHYVTHFSAYLLMPNIFCNKLSRKCSNVLQRNEKLRQFNFEFQSVGVRCRSRCYSVSISEQICNFFLKEIRFVSVLLSLSLRWQRRAKIVSNTGATQPMIILFGGSTKLLPKASRLEISVKHVLSQNFFFFWHSFQFIAKNILSTDV